MGRQRPSRGAGLPANERTKPLELEAELVVECEARRQRLDDPTHLLHHIAQLCGDHADIVKAPVDASDGMAETVEHNREFDKQPSEGDQDAVEFAQRTVDLGDRFVDVQAAVTSRRALRGIKANMSAIP